MANEDIALRGAPQNAGDIFPLYLQARQAAQREQLFPIQQQAAQVGLERQQFAQSKEQNDQINHMLLQGALRIKPLLDRGDAQGALKEMILAKQEMATAGLDISRIDNAIEQFQTNPESFKAAVDDTVNLWQQQHGPASFQDFQRTAAAAGLKPGDPDYIRAARIDAGLDPRAVGSASQTIADTGKTQPVAESEAVIEGAKAAATESSKLSVQRDLKPQIENAVTLARKDAEARGEALTNLKRARASLPGLRVVVGQLSELADIATYTTSGKFLNSAIKEFGFGATEGATARAKMISIVRNQVLPLLRETFGPQFTKDEGQKLEDMVIDPDASPAERKAQLTAFIEQKLRNIEKFSREVGEQKGDQRIKESKEDLMKEWGISLD